MKLQIILRPDFCFGLAAMLMLFPVSWCFAWLCAAFVHELCHYILLRLCGSKVYSVQLGLNGMLMAAQPLTPGKEIFCALAGPFGGLLLLLFAMVKLDHHTGLRDFLTVSGLCVSLFGGVYYCQFVQSQQNQK